MIPGGKHALLCFLLCQILLPLLVLSDKEEEKVNFKVVPGVYTEELPSPIFYETYAPVLLKYQLPHWNKSEVTFNNWYSCISETVPFRYTCPVVFHMNKAIINLHIDFESIQPVRDYQSHDEFYSKLFAGSDFCDSIRKHFSGIYIQKSELNNYLAKLEQCHLGSGSNYMDLMLSNYNFSIRHPFTRIENNFYNTFYKNINSSLELVASATLSNARATIQATMLSVFYAEKNRWTHAVQDCRSGVIPHSVVTFAKFNETVTQFVKAMSATPSLSNRELSIPLELISKYYNLPLTDCTFTDDAFVTRILLPMRDKSTKALSKKLYRLNPIQFQYKGKLCKVGIQHEVEELHLYDEEQKIAYKTNCKPNELCQISSVFMPDKIDPCVTAVLSQDFDEFIKNCPFECKDRLGGNNLLISKVQSDTYVFVGKVEGLLDNYGKPDLEQQTVTIETLDDYFGGIEVKLPCKSKLTIGEKVLFSDKPCGTGNEENLYSQYSIAPWHFSRSKDSIVDVGLLDLYIDGGKQRPEHEAIIAPTTNSSDNSSSNALIWVVFSIVAIILFTLQVFIIYQFNKIHGVTGQTLQSMLFRRGGRDPEPEIRLIH